MILKNPVQRIFGELLKCEVRSRVGGWMARSHCSQAAESCCWDLGGLHSLIKNGPFIKKK